MGSQMIGPIHRPVAFDMALSMLGAPRFISALATATITTAVLTFLIRQTIGWPGLIAMLVLLVVLMAGAMIARRDTIEWNGLLPVSLLIFVGWAGLSLLWSDYRGATVQGLAYLGCFTALGIGIALLRDTIQIVRAFGDVLRIVLALSLALEIISGLLIDTPISFLDIQGNLDTFGPIQGVFGARNQLGLIAVLAVVTFLIEFRTRSVHPWLATGSLILSGVILLFSRSPLVGGALAVTIVAAAILYLVRRASPERRRVLQAALLALSGVAVVTAWSLRSIIIDISNAGGELSYRLSVWMRAWDLIQLHPIQGWGWIGSWRGQTAPYQFFASVQSRVPESATNAFVDVWLQLGLVGLAIFLGLVMLTFTRSWLLASRQRSVVYTWPALIVVVLGITALAESSLIVEFGWLTFVVCSVKAAHSLSWRTAFRELRDATAPGTTPGAR